MWKLLASVAMLLLASALIYVSFSAGRDELTASQLLKRAHYGGQYILDCAFGPIPSGRELAAKLDGVVGVVEHGLFIGMTTAVVVGRASGVTVLTQDKPK